MLTAVLTSPTIGTPPNNIQNSGIDVFDQRDIQVAKISSDDPTLNGDFVVVWQDEFQSPDLIDTDIYYRLYEANGAPKTNAAAINFIPVNDEQDPRVAIADDGSFVVTWEVLNDSGNFDVMHRRFDPTGAPLAEETLVHEDNGFDQRNPDVAVYANGDYVIAWQHEPADGTDDIQVRRYLADGTPIDAQPIDVADTDRVESLPRIAVPKGVGATTFILTWTDVSGRGDLDVWRDVRSRANGTTISDPAIVNDEPAAVLDREQLQGAVDADTAGNFVVVFYEEVSDTNSDVYFRRYDAAGNPLDVMRLPVDEDPDIDAEEHAVAVAGNGSFIVTYEVSNGISGTQDVKFLFFGADGERRGLPHDPANFPATPVDSPYPTPPPATTPPQEPAEQENPEIHANRSGEFTIVWHDDFFTTTGEDVFALNFRHDVETVGLYSPDTAQFFLRNDNSSGVADIEFRFGYVPSGVLPRLIPIEGDWEGDGITTIALYDPSSAVFYMRSDNIADSTTQITAFQYGQPGWIPVAGDFNGDGIDSIGAYDPNTAFFYLRNANELRDASDLGAADITPFRYGSGNPGQIPIIGDWDGDGVDTIGLYNSTLDTQGIGRFFLRNTNTTGSHDILIDYDIHGMLPVSGDWDRDGIDTIGIYDPTLAHFRLRNSNTPGLADIAFHYGPIVPVGTTTWVPLMGDWDGPGADALHAASSVPAGTNEVVPLEMAEVQSVLDVAIGAWVSVGLDAHRAASLGQVSISVVDLPGSLLGLAEGYSIQLDEDAAGYGWFVDPTPTDNEEFAQQTASQWLANGDGAAASRYDLLTTVIHELGHVLGFEDGTDADVMNGVLELGMRRQPSADAVDSLLGL